MTKTVDIASGAVIKSLGVTNRDNTNVDMLVKDIYGKNSPFKELGEDLLASSFAKMATVTPLYE